MFKANFLRNTPSLSPFWDPYCKSGGITAGLPIEFREFIIP